MNMKLKNSGSSFFTFVALFTFAILLSNCGNKNSQQNPGNSEGLNAEAAVSPNDPWTEADIILPVQLNKELSENNKPVLLHVGFGMLYDQNHIPGTKYMGPASQPNGMANLKNEIQSLDKNQEIVLYCGCCPWTDCPNVRPAFKTVHDMGYTNVKVLYIPRSFVQDWVDKGYSSVK